MDDIGEHPKETWINFSTKRLFEDVVVNNDDDSDIDKVTIGIYPLFLHTFPLIAYLGIAVFLFPISNFPIKT